MLAGPLKIRELIRLLTSSSFQRACMSAAGQNIVLSVARSGTGGAGARRRGGGTAAALFRRRGSGRPGCPHQAVGIEAHQPGPESIHIREVMRHARRNIEDVAGMQRSLHPVADRLHAVRGDDHSVCSGDRAACGHDPEIRRGVVVNGGRRGARCGHSR